MTWRLRDTQSSGLPIDSRRSIHDETTNRFCLPIHTEHWGQARGAGVLMGNTGGAVQGPEVSLKPIPLTPLELQ